MNERAWLAVDPNAVAINLFGVINSGSPPNIWVVHLGRDAYEAGQLYLYLKELLYVRDSDIVEVPALLTYLAIVAARQAGEVARVEVVEYGSTLFSAIDKMAICDKLLASCVDWQTVEFIGVEPLDTFSLLTKLLHPDWNITIYPHHSRVPEASGLRIERSFQATAYGFGSCQDLVDWISRSSFAVHGIWVSRDRESVLVQMGGKRVLLVGFDEFCDSLQHLGYSTTLIQSVKLEVADGHFFETWLACYRTDLPFLDTLNGLYRESRLKLGLQGQFTGFDGRRCSFAEVKRASTVNRRYNSFVLGETQDTNQPFGRESFDFYTDELCKKVCNYFSSV